MENSTEKELECVRCGTCKALCPTYSESGNESMSPRGRLMLMNMLQQEDDATPAAIDRIFSCMLCGSCDSTCPLGVDVTSRIYQARSELACSDKKLRALGLFAKYALRYTSLAFPIMRLMQKTGALRLLSRTGLTGIIDEMGIEFASKTLREDGTLYKTGRQKGRIALFAGCTINYIYPQIGRQLIKTLTALGYDVVIPSAEVCCGAPLLSLGMKKEAALKAEQNIRAFGRLRVEAVISLCPTCTDFLKNTYMELIGECIQNAMDFSEFVSANSLAGSLTSSSAYKNKKIMFHDPCHSLYKLKIKKEPREILAGTGIKLTEPRQSGCCGLAGAFRVLYKDMSESMLNQRKLDYDDADTIITSCPNCIIQLRTKLKDKEIRHIAEMLLPNNT
ncbi:MAG: (Fe-S)-binding protein [Nitrospiraceae bacterium]|nr:(Fe-S)-binding protein [Nitrospiraceae bacterium]